MEKKDSEQTCCRETVKSRLSGLNLYPSLYCGFRSLEFDYDSGLEVILNNYMHIRPINIQSMFKINFSKLKNFKV